ncbi:MAG: hypothetical protein OEW69_04925 [Nitrospirota bacterium]|nr:hypothetical protein [Nitrospirota bacterium]
MHRLFIIFTLIFLSAVTYSEAAVDMGISIGDEGIRSFYLAIGDYYRVPEKEVIIIKERRIHDEEIPVVFFIAKKARVKPATIINLRLRGMTWLDITLHHHLSPEIFYMPVKETVVIGPPYGKAYGYYKKKPKKEWKKIVLGDDDIINLVNLRFMSEHYRYAPEKVIKLREEGKNFIVINEEVKKGKKGDKEKIKSKGEGKEEKGEKGGKEDKGKGKGKKD